MADVLVVEDDGSIRDLLALVVEDLGHDVRLATTAEDALLRSAEQRPDLLVLDLGLPGRDGPELLSMLTRGIGRPRSLLIVSAAREEEIRPVATRYGARYLTKPFLVDDLQDAVTEALEAVRQLSELAEADAAASDVGSAIAAALRDALDADDV